MISAGRDFQEEINHQDELLIISTTTITIVTTMITQIETRNVIGIQEVTETIEIMIGMMMGKEGDIPIDMIIIDDDSYKDSF